MLQQIIELLPDKVAQVRPDLAMGIAAGGVLLGLVGARLSRSILPLALVAAGTIIGIHMPHWFGWKIDPMGTAFGAAILLGLSGYVLSTLWEGLLFATLLALGAGVAVWLALAGTYHWQWPVIDESATAVEACTKIWLSFPTSLNRPLAVGIGLGFATGISLVVSSPRVGRILFYSILGMLLFVICGTIGLQKHHPDWVASFPTTSWIQGGIFALMVGVAAIVQWLLMRVPEAPKPVAVVEEEPEPAEDETPDNVKEKPKAKVPVRGSPLKMTPPPPPKWALARRKQNTPHNRGDQEKTSH